MKMFIHTMELHVLEYKIILEKKKAWQKYNINNNY